MKYNKEHWRTVSVAQLKKHLKNYSKLNNLLESHIVGFTSAEHIVIKNKLKKGEDLVGQVLKDKLGKNF